MNFKQMTSLFALTLLVASANAIAMDVEEETHKKPTSKTEVIVGKPVEDGTPLAHRPSDFGDLTQSVIGFTTHISRDTRGYGVEWWGPYWTGGRTLLQDFQELRDELLEATPPEIKDDGFSYQVKSFQENYTPVELWPEDTRTWYTQNGADNKWLKEEVKRLVYEGKTKVRLWPFALQQMIVHSDNIRKLGPELEKANVKLDFRSKK